MKYICECCKKEKETDFLRMLFRKDDKAEYGLCEECAIGFYKYMMAKNKK